MSTERRKRSNKKGLKYKGHVLVSFFVLACLLFINAHFSVFQLTQYSFILLFLISFFYGLLPDIDTFESKIGKIFLSLSLILIAVCFFFGFNNLGLAITFILISFIFIKHRGITHTLSAGLIFSLPLLFAGPEFFIVALLCFTSHLVADGHIKLI